MTILRYINLSAYGVKLLAVVAWYELKKALNDCDNSVVFILPSSHPSFTIYIRKGAESTNRQGLTWNCLQGWHVHACMYTTHRALLVFASYRRYMRADFARWYLSLSSNSFGKTNIFLNWDVSPIVIIFFVIEPQKSWKEHIILCDLSLHPVWSFSVSTIIIFGAMGKATQFCIVSHTLEKLSLLMFNTLAHVIWYPPYGKQL